MKKPARKRITMGIDTLIAIIGVIVGVGMTIWLAFVEVNRVYAITGIFATLACASYLFIKKSITPEGKSTPNVEQSSSLRIYLLLSITFFILLSCALISFVTRPELYVTPITYFLSMALASAVLAVQILIMPSNKNYCYFTLFMIVILAIVLIWTPQMVFPSLLGMDTYAHRQFTEAILNTAHIPVGEGYSAFPFMHLTTCVTMLLTNLNYKTAIMLSVDLSYVVVILSVVFLLGSFVHSFKVGLMAALLLGFSTIYVHEGWWMVPNAYAMVFILVAVWLLFKTTKSKNPICLTALAIFLMAATILTHPIATIAMALALFLFWLGPFIYHALYGTGSQRIIHWSVLVLFVAAAFTWWWYSSPTTINTLKQLIETRFNIDLFSHQSSVSIAYMSSIPLIEHLVPDLDVILFLAISLFGCLAFFSKRYGNTFNFVLIINGILLITIGFLSGPLELGTIEERWQFMSMLWLAIPAGLGLTLVCVAIRRNSIRIISLFVFVVALAFISLLSPTANIDNSLLAKNSTVRYAFTSSELQALGTISGWGEEITTDSYYLNGYEGTDKTQDISDNLISKDFSDLKGIVIIREEIVGNPFFLSGAFKLNYDPRQILLEQGFSQVYDCGTVSAFSQ